MKLQAGERAERPDRFHVGGVLVHRSAGAEGRSERVEIIAPSAAASRVQRLLVRSRTCGRSAVEILRGHDDIDAASFQLDRGAQSRRAASQHQRLASVQGHAKPRHGQLLARGSSRMAFGHIDVGEGVEHGLRKRNGHARFLMKIAIDDVASLG